MCHKDFIQGSTQLLYCIKTKVATEQGIDLEELKKKVLEIQDIDPNLVNLTDYGFFFHGSIYDEVIEVRDSMLPKVPAGDSESEHEGDSPSDESKTESLEANIENKIEKEKNK